MARQTAPFLEPYPAQRQVELIMDNQDMLGIDLAISENLLHCAPAPIHKGERFEKQPRIAVDHPPFPENEISLRIRRQSDTPGFAINETVHDHKPEIVTGPVVLATRITKTYDETGVSHGILICVTKGIETARGL
jgi:hypothetical protein